MFKLIKGGKAKLIDDLAYSLAVMDFKDAPKRLTDEEYEALVKEYPWPSWQSRPPAIHRLLSEEQAARAMDKERAEAGRMLCTIEIHGPEAHWREYRDFARLAVGFVIKRLRPQRQLELFED